MFAAVVLTHIYIERSIQPKRAREREREKVPVVVSWLLRLQKASKTEAKRKFCNYGEL